MNTTAVDGQEIQLRIHRLVPRLLCVVDDVMLAPSMRRLVFGGDDLREPFPFLPLAVADHVKLVFPEPATGEIHLPAVADGRLVMPPGRPRPLFRDYTVRALDRVAGRLTIDFVLHDHGPAGRWARSATTGDQLGFLGPRGSHLYPGGFENYLIAGDETALPAMARWMEELPAGATAHVFASLASMAEKVELPRRAGTTLRYLDRSVHGPGVLADAVRAFAAPVDGLFVWVAGEASAVRPIRSHVRDVLGVPAGHTDIDGYWKAGVAGLDHHAEDNDDQD
ncbi:siderophore-interacting protein [Arthrobacter antibioticus]|uniref:siderophore-interacting protein n=1 Tax=Arthrobacter sp. H35-MC1 TaxID=3046203 RepID=UPI0024BB2F61|nr:siderophore-interacting protein [Arthrobacter sp. H35-MC1]MDJ0318320.1 siderophore-interacting protein [Arthrobacter sp. H35-MC1]